MVMAVEGVHRVCPGPVPHWMADSAGKGILIVAVWHGLAQLEARWHSSGARAIWDTAGIKVILGGVGDPDTLDRLSRLSGEVAPPPHARTLGEDRQRAPTATYHPHRVLPPHFAPTLPRCPPRLLRGHLS